jgi:hypothetical protein
MPLVSPSEMAWTFDNRLLEAALGGEQDARGTPFFFVKGLPRQQLVQGVTEMPIVSDSKFIGGLQYPQYVIFFIITESI